MAHWATIVVPLKSTTRPSKCFDARLLLTTVLSVDENAPTVDGGIVALRIRPIGLLAATVLEEGVPATVACEDISNEGKRANLAEAFEELQVKNIKIKN